MAKPQERFWDTEKAFENPRMLRWPMLRFQARWALDSQGFCIGYRSSKIALECRKRPGHSDLGLRLSISKSQALPRLLCEKRNKTNFCGRILSGT